MTDSRVLVVVAHPDDETFGCGSTLLYASARGATTTVCCATRGEAGEPAVGSGVTATGLAAVREDELYRAATLLGVSEVELLDFRDSGMDGEPGAGSLVGADLEAVVAAVTTVVERVRPHVVVTLDASDGHRDHARIRDATLAAVDRASWEVEAVYLQCLPRSLLRRWADVERQRKPDSPYLDVDEALMGTPDDDITTVLDTSAHVAARRAAIALHASQVSPYAGLPDDLEQAFLAADHLQQVRRAVRTEPTTHDPFAGPGPGRG